MENLDEENLDLDVVGTPINTDDAGIQDYDTITIEQIADLFGVQEVLGCGASFNQYSEWYNGLGIETESPINVEQMFNDYLAICEAEGVYYIPPNADTPKERSFKTLGLIAGAAVLYSVLKK